MKYSFIAFLSLLVFSSCSENTTTITADLTFISVSFSNFYGASDEGYASLLHQVDSIVTHKKDTSDSNLKLSKYFKKLEKLNLLRVPSIFLKIEKDSTITLFLSEDQHEKVKHFKHRDLYKEGKKVMLQLQLQDKGDNIYYSDSIIKVEKVDGKSRSNI